MKKLLNMYYKFENFFVGAVLMMMAVVVVLQVAARYVLETPFLWAEELATYCQVVLCCSSVGFMIRNKKQIFVSVFYEMLPGWLQKICDVIINFVALFCFVLVGYGGVMVCIQSSILRAFTMDWLPLSAVYVFLPVGMCVAFLYTLPLFFKSITALFKKNEKGDEV